MVSHLRTPILNCFTYLLWSYLLTDSEFSCLAMLAKPYPVSGPTYLPQIPNQLHCMSKCAHEVLGTILEARLMPVFIIKSIATCSLGHLVSKGISKGCAWGLFGENIV